MSNKESLEDKIERLTSELNYCKKIMENRLLEDDLLFTESLNDKDVYFVFFPDQSELAFRYNEVPPEIKKQFKNYLKYGKSKYNI